MKKTNNNLIKLINNIQANLATNHANLERSLSTVVQYQREHEEKDPSQDMLNILNDAITNLEVSNGVTRDELDYAKELAMLSHHSQDSLLSTLSGIYDSAANCLCSGLNYLCLGSIDNVDDSI